MTSIGKSKVGFIGVGKLGQACAEMVAEKHDVVGYDIGTRTPENFKMVNTMAEAVRGRDIVFIAVETPHDPLYDGKAPTSHLPNKDFDYSVVKHVLREVNEVATKDQLIVLISTVLPGTTRREFIDLIPNSRFVYNPYLIAMGTVKWDMVNPEMIMIGTEDGTETGDAKELVDFYKTIMQNDPPYHIGTWDECECIKVFYNTFISAKVSLVNMIQDVAEKQGNINAEFVCDALAKSDRRIMGPAYMKPGMGDGGHCHPRDNIALRYMAQELGLGYDLFDSIMLSREVQAKNMAERLMEIAQEEDIKDIVIVGKAYKPLVPYDGGSASMLVGHYIESSPSYNLYYLDEVIGDKPPANLGKAVYLMAHCPEITYGAQLDFVDNWYADHSVSAADTALTVSTANGTALTPVSGSVVVDPWRRTPEMPNVRVVHYGNTRKEALRDKKTIKINLDIPGWTSEQCLTMLAKEAASVPDNGWIVEIGSMCGRSSYALGMNKDPSVTLTCIDPFPFDEHLLDSGIYGNVGNGKYSFNNFQDNTACIDNLEVLRMFSPPTCSAMSFTKPIDLLWIDGGHAYHEVMADINFWYPLVKPGGVIIFDDYEANQFQEVVDAVDEAIVQYGITDFKLDGDNRQLRMVKNK